MCSRSGGGEHQDWLFQIIPDGEKSFFNILLEPSNSAIINTTGLTLIKHLLCGSPLSPITTSQFLSRVSPFSILLNITLLLITIVSPVFEISIWTSSQDKQCIPKVLEFISLQTVNKSVFSSPGFSPETKTHIFSAFLLRRSTQSNSSLNLSPPTHFPGLFSSYVG